MQENVNEISWFYPQFLPERLQEYRGVRPSVRSRFGLAMGREDVTTSRRGRNSQSEELSTGRQNSSRLIYTWTAKRRKRTVNDWCSDVDRIRFVHDEIGRCYLLLETCSSPSLEMSTGGGEQENTTTFSRTTSLPVEPTSRLDTDSPPAYSPAPGEDIVTDATFNKDPRKSNDGLLLAPGLINPFLGIRRKDTSTGIFENLGVIDLPFNLDIAKKSLTSTISALYAMMLIVSCLVFVSTEVITEKVPMDFFETKGFYTYLYLGSIIFMFYIFFYVLRVKVTGKERDTTQDEVDEFIRKMKIATGMDVKEVVGRPGDTGDTRRLAVQSGARRSGSTMIPGQKREKEMLVKLMTSENEKSHGSMMLRMGAIAFGLGTLIYTGLEFVHFFEINPECENWHILHGVNPVLHMLFTFMQMYYLFMHARMNIQKNKIIAKFGLMHLLATNCCIWIRTLVRESVREIVESEEFAQVVSDSTRQHFKVHRHTNITVVSLQDDDCEGLDIMGNTIENSSIYLFPFIIEYSMIGGHIIYNMWKNVGRRPIFKMVGDGDDVNDHKQRPYLRMDWSSSAIGLFLGLLALVTLTITLILYFALVNQENFHLIAVLMINVNDTIINCLMVLAIIIGFIQIRNLQFVQDTIQTIQN